MPFKSEKQRKYLWANEPGIARDWTDKYGSRVKKETGGITRIPFANGLDYLKNIGQDVASYASIPWNFGMASLGLPYQYSTQSMRNTMDAAARKNAWKTGTGDLRGHVGYADLGAQEGSSGEFLGMNPDMTAAQIALALTSGDVDFRINKEGKINYDPTTTAYDMLQEDPTATTKTGNPLLDLINQGGLLGQRTYTPLESTFDLKTTPLQGISKYASKAGEGIYNLVDAFKNEFGGRAQAAEASMKGWEKEENDRKMRTKMNEQKIAFENQFGRGTWGDRHALAKRAMTQPKEVLEWKSLDPDFDKLPEALQDLMGGERFRATTKWTDPYSFPSKGPYKYTPAETNVASANKSTTSGINGRNGLAKNWSVFDGFNVDGDFIGEGLTSEEEEEYNEYLRSIGQMPTIKDPNIFQRAIGGIRGGINRANEYNRSYNRVAPGANVTPWGGGGNLYNPAVQGRRNENWMNSIIGNYTMGIGGTQNVKQNLINKYGTVQQQQNFADAIARKTHNPYANYDYFEGQGVDRADITADVTGMYTDSGSSGMDDIGDITTTESSPASDIEGIWVARGGMVKDAPRYRYAEGGIVNLLPKGAW